MKVLTLALTILLGMQFAFAQKTTRRPPLKDKFSLSWGNEHKDKSTVNKFIGTIGDNTYVLKRGRRNLIIDKLNDKLDVILSEEIEMTYGDEELSIMDAILFNENIFIVGSYRNKRSKMSYLFYQKLDLNNLAFADDLVKIAEYSYEDGSRRDRGAFDFEISKDKSKLFVYYNIPVDGESAEAFGFHVYDKELGLIWERDVELPYAEDLFSIIEYELDNDGSVYVLGKLYNEKAKDKRKGSVNYEMRLLSFEESSDEPEVYEIGITDVFLKDMSIVFKKDEIVCVGFYSADLSSSAKGCFALSIDKESKEISNSVLEEFSLDFLTLNMTEKEIKKVRKKAAKGKETESGSMTIRNILLRENGSIVVVAEEYYVTVTTTTSANGTTSTTYHYYYNDIVVFSISPEYNIEWYNKVPKLQHTKNDGGFYSSFFFLPTSDRLFFVYNDHVKNLHVMKSGKGSYFNGSKKNSVAVCFSMDYEGNTGKTKLFNVKAEEILVRPKVCARGGTNEILIFAQRKKDQRYGRVTYVER